MYHFCTYFDANYLTRGLALHESLGRYCREPFVLWILCFDQLTHDVLSRLELANTRLIAMDDFEKDDPALRAVKPTRTLVEYYWTSTPSLPLYVLGRDQSVDMITYLDADLWFFSDPQPIFDEFVGGSILVTEHRYSDAYKDRVTTSGRFNVSLLSFRRDENGMGCLTCWRQQCLDWCFARFEDGKFGDQLYLNEWPDRFEGVVVLRHKGAGLAPWNMARYHLQCGETGLTVDDVPLVFYHFHGCRQVSGHVFQPMDSHYCPFFSEDAMQRLYLPYIRQLDVGHRQARRAIGSFRCLMERAGASPGTIVSGVLTQELLWTTWPRLGLILWRIGGDIRRRRESARVLGGRGLREYKAGNLTSARRWYLAAAGENPLLLCNRHVVSVLVRTLLSSSGAEPST